MATSIDPFPLTIAKSRTRRNKAFAIRGVPLDLLAMRIAASYSVGTFNISALRSTMVLSNSTS